MTFATKFPPFNKRSSLPREAGKALMRLSAARAGNPANPNSSVMPEFIKRKIAASFEHGAQPATNSTKTREHFSPKKGK